MLNPQDEEVARLSAGIPDEVWVGMLEHRNQVDSAAAVRANDYLVDEYPDTRLPYEYMSWEENKKLLRLSEYVRITNGTWTNSDHRGYRAYY